MNQVFEEIENKLPGFLPCLGGGELTQATQALFGTKELQTKESAERLAQRISKPVVLQHLSVESEEDPNTKELLHSVHRFAVLSHRLPPNFEDKYHYGLLLQELAAKLRFDTDNKACDQYEEALRLKPKFHAALYNWGVALSELSSLYKGSDGRKARHYLHLASQKYLESIRGSNNNPRGLNNWGLVLQEVSNYETDPEVRLRLAVQSIEKFRLAVRFQLDFDHGCYNMGTIYYTHAAHIRDAFKKSDDLSYAGANGALIAPLQELTGIDRGIEEAANAMMRSAAQYICLAAALQPTSTVYHGSVSIVKHMLPRPFVKVGHLKVARYRSLGEVKESWERQWFSLDAARFASGIGRQYLRGGSYVPPKNRDREEPGPDDYDIAVKDIQAIDRCIEMALPEGHAFWIQTPTHQQGLYFLCEDGETAETWVDALKLCQYLFSAHRSSVLSEMLGP